MCFDGYITIDSSSPSKSGLYVTGLPGMNLATLSGIKKTEQVNTAALFANLYQNAQINMKIDLQRKLAGRFHIDKKLITRETSEFKSEVNSGSELAGVKISVSLPKYARLHILSIGVDADQAYQDSPGVNFYIHKENAAGELLSTITSELEEGKNTIQVYQEFEEEEIFIGYDPSEISLNKTRNKYYADNSILSGFHQDLGCMFPCKNGDFGTVLQINGGGLNVKFLLYCSMEKVICENLPLFSYALWYRLGVEILKERLISDRVTRFTVVTPEEATRLMQVVNDDYAAAMDAAVMNIKMTEDPICFTCKSTVTSKTNLP